MDEVFNIQEEFDPAQPPVFTFAKEKNLDYDVQLTKAGIHVREPKTILEKQELFTEPEGQLTIDVYQTPSHIVIESAVAGVNPNDLEIQVSNDSISIRGARKREKQVQEEDYLYQECYWGRFARSIILPQEVDPEAAVATFKNGILTVELPKLERQKSKKLNVRFE